MARGSREDETLLKITVGIFSLFFPYSVLCFPYSLCYLLQEWIEICSPSVNRSSRNSLKFIEIRCGILDVKCSMLDRRMR